MRPLGRLCVARVRSREVALVVTVHVMLPFAAGGCSSSNSPSGNCSVEYPPTYSLDALCDCSSACELDGQPVAQACQSCTLYPTLDCSLAHADDWLSPHITWTIPLSTYLPFFDPTWAVDDLKIWVNAAFDPHDVTVLLNGVPDTVCTRAAAKIICEDVTSWVQTIGIRYDIDTPLPVVRGAAMVDNEGNAAAAALDTCQW